MTTLTPGSDGSGPFSGPAASLHVGPDGITAPGVHLGADGLSLATTGAGVVDPGQAAAAAAMINAAAASSVVRALRLNADGLQVNPGAPDSTTLKLNGDGIAITAPRVSGSGGSSSSTEQATVQLKLPNAAAPNGSLNAGLAALAPRLAFSVVPDSATGAEIAVGTGAGRGAAAGAATSAALGQGAGSVSVGSVAGAPDPNKNGGISASAAGVRVGIPTVNALPTPVVG